MVRIKRFNESVSVPSDEGRIRQYLESSIVGNENIFEQLDTMRSTWSEDDCDNAIESGACMNWNTEISDVLRGRGIRSVSYMGTPKDDSLPDHYITISDDKIIDFVAEQFWGYGLGDGVDEGKAVFSREEYDDIYTSYRWSSI